MLVAYGPEGHPVVAEETPLEQLLSWSREQLLSRTSLFIGHTQEDEVWVSGDGVLRFSHLIAAGLAEPHLVRKHDPWCFYAIRLTPKGKHILDAWYSGNRKRVLDALNDLPPSTLVLMYLDRSDRVVLRLGRVLV